jgi:hypothetical protein
MVTQKPSHRGVKSRSRPFVAVLELLKTGVARRSIFANEKAPSAQNSAAFRVRKGSHPYQLDFISILTVFTLRVAPRSRVGRHPYTGRLPPECSRHPWIFDFAVFPSVATLVS